MWVELDARDCISVVANGNIVEPLYKVHFRNIKLMLLEVFYTVEFFPHSIMKVVVERCVAF